ncbi:hypothetical protein BD770DRAFT_400581 [Pilaira anomala]|nr:hypothetical protein BD770DRAFT_400581 [Pilaira anomala]
MNKYPNLPSISTLLTLPPSPPRIVVENVQQDDDDEEGYLKSPNHHHHARLSPMLSPIDSYPSSINSFSSPNLNPQQQQQQPQQQQLSPLPAMLSLPPLQGDDPPRRLQRHPSVSSITSPKPTYNSLWSLSSTTSPYCTPEPIVTPPSPMMLSSRSVSPPTSVERPPLPPSTQIVLSESGQPILKRRRGRPPSMREPTLEGGWTFLTPTVWDVNQPTQPQPQQSQQPQNTTTAAAASTAAATDSVMNGSMAAFTSSTMDMVLQMPRKKRGRKPKTHIVGNSCFVWKDITASRRSTKVIKEQKAALRK